MKKRMGTILLAAVLLLTSVDLHAFAAGQTALAPAEAQVSAKVPEQAESGENAPITETTEAPEETEDETAVKETTAEGTQEDSTESTENTESTAEDGADETETLESVSENEPKAVEVEMEVLSALSNSTFAAKLSEIEKRFPAGSKYDDNLYGSNGRIRGRQCFGYAHWAANYVFGGVVWANSDSFNWTKVYSMANVKAGDIIQYGPTSDGTGHTIFVTKVSGDTITFTDANSDGRNTVRWRQTIQRNAKYCGKSFSYVKSSPAQG